MTDQKMVVFNDRAIRHVFHNDVKQYIKRMRSRDQQLDSNWGTICTPP